MARHTSGTWTLGEPYQHAAGWITRELSADDGQNSTHIADVNVSSHTFHFVTPTVTDTLNIPNACNVCHTDKDTAWATVALKTWSDRSPWRVSR